MGEDFLNYMDMCYQGKHPRTDYIYTFVICQHDQMQLQKEHQQHKQEKNVDQCGRPLKQKDGEEISEDPEKNLEDEI